ncbi:hypothetical protein [Marinobacter nanhaiticus]|nr:hypothetical protein [Marinobacter nanhaiticus]
MGPGNPTDDPVKGAALFNDWQCAVAAGREPNSDSASRLGRIISTCLENQKESWAKLLANEIVRINREPDYFLTMDFCRDDYPGPGVQARSELPFLHAAIKELPAETVIKLKGAANERH